MQVPMDQASGNPSSLRQRSRIHSLSPGSLCSPRRARRRPSVCIHVTAQPGVSRTRVHTENPNRSHIGDEWYLNTSNVPSTPPSSPLIGPVRHNGRDIFLVTGVRERLQPILPSSRLFRGGSSDIEITDENSQVGDSRTSGRPHARTLTHSIRRYLPFNARKQPYSSIAICWPLEFLEKFHDA